MNVKKLIELSKKEHPNPWLAELSIKWSEHTKILNPVINAVGYQGYVKFFTFNLVFLLGWLAPTVVFRLYLPWDPSRVWLWVGGAALVLALASIGALIETRYLHNDARQFAEAIDWLEIIEGEPIEDWPSNLDLNSRAHDFLTNLATAVKTDEQIMKASLRRAPWKKPETNPAGSRSRFEQCFSLLTKALGLPQDRAVYFGEVKCAAAQKS